MRLKIILVSLVLLFCLVEGSDYEDNTEDNADYEGDIISVMMNCSIITRSHLTRVY